jgi:RNA polymerase sigma-70 factor (ECF subfamily)
MTDTAIISTIIEGNSKGYSMLIKRHKSRLYYFVFGMVHNTMDAEDLTMIAFEKAFSKLNKWNKDSCKFSTWLYSIARNTVIDFIRSNESRLIGGEDVSKYTALHDECYTPEEKLMHAENVKIIEERIDGLSKKRRELIKLHIEGHKDEDIAKMLGVSHVAVRAKLNRTREQLKQLLYEENIPFISHCIAQ